MAIHPIHPHQDVSPQTGHVTESLNNSSTSLPSGAHRISVSLAIPLDEHSTSKKEAPQPASSRNGLSTVHTRQEPIHRDSLKRREALLKGKEGSRRRQRWENGSSWPEPGRYVLSVI